MRRKIIFVYLGIVVITAAIVGLLACLTARHTSVFNAIGAADSTAVAEYLKRGRNVNARGPLDSTLLHFAVMDPRHISLDIVENLIAYGADVNARNAEGLTPLHFAAAYGRTDVALILLNAGADVNARTKAGDTPLRRAVMARQSDVADLLRKHGGLD